MPCTYPSAHCDLCETEFKEGQFICNTTGWHSTIEEVLETSEPFAVYGRRECCWNCRSSSDSTLKIVVHYNCLNIIADFIHRDEVQFYGLIKKAKNTNRSSDGSSSLKVEKWVNLQGTLPKDHIIRKTVEELPAELVAMIIEEANESPLTNLKILEAVTEQQKDKMYPVRGLRVLGKDSQSQLETC